MANTYTYTVESFHINVASGDGAIHLLTHGNTNTPNVPRKVIRAIFLDGGRGGERAVRSTIRTTIDVIEGTYDCTNRMDGNINRLRFDAFVVSHWDGDHYEGIVNMLASSVTNTPMPNMPQLPGGGIQSKMLLNRAFYNTNTGDPESYLIAPHFTSPKRDYTGQPDEAEMLSLCDELRVKFLNGPLELPNNSTNITIITKGLLGQIARNTNQLKLRVEHGDLLGRNLFDLDDGQMANINAAGINSLQLFTDAKVNYRPDYHRDLALLAQAPDRIPAMYCIAVNKRTMGQTQLGVMTTPTNKSSICCMVVWDDSHRSHFLAGDADIGLEGKILNWTNPGWNQGVATPKVSTMKLSHHGARSSNPVQMVAAFDPLSIVASAGDVLSHAHPRWEILVLLNLWRVKRDGVKYDEPNKWLHRILFLTCYPIWLMTDGTEYFLLDKNTGELGDPKFLKNWEYLDSMSNYPSDSLDFWPKLMKATKNSKKKGEKKNNDGQAKVICQQLDKSLKDISFIGPHQCGLKGNGIFNMLNTTQPLNGKDVAYIQVSSTGSRETEGVTDVCLMDGSEFGDHTSFNQLRAALGTNNPSPAKRDEYSDEDELDFSWTDVNGQLIGNTFKKYHQEGKSTISTDLQDISSWDWVELEKCGESGEGVSRKAIESLNRRVPPPRAHISSSKKYFFLIPETSKELPKDSAVARIPKQHPLFHFMISLDWQGFGLEQQPIAGKAISLLESDEIARWFSSITETRLSPISVTFTSWPPANAAVRSLEDDITLDSKASLQMAFDFSIAGNPLTMDTKSATTVLTSVDESSLEQMLIRRGILVFGLNPNCSSFTISMAKLAEFIGFQTNNYYALKILGAISLKLDVESGGKKSGTRNALWFRPMERYETVLRLQFQADTDVLNSWLKDHIGDVGISQIKVIGRKVARLERLPQGDRAVCEGLLAMVMDFEIEGLKLQATLSISQETVTLSLKNDRIVTDGLSRMLSWLGKKIGNTTLNLNSLLKSAGDYLDSNTVTFRKLDIALGVDKNGKLNGIKSINLAFQALMKIGGSGSQSGVKTAVVFLFDFQWSRIRGCSLRGCLWPSMPTLGIEDYITALPGWEQHLEFQPITGDSELPASTLNLKTLLASETVDNIPDGIPTNITQAALEISSSELSFTGKIQCDPPKTDGKVPTLVLDEVSLQALYNWDKEDANNGLQLKLAVDVMLYPPTENNANDDLPQLEPALLRGRLEYKSKSKSWSLSARLEDLTIAHIASFWLERSRKGAMAFLEKFRINYLTLDYDYAPVPGGSGKKFKFEGLLSLGILFFNFSYKNEDGEWLFKADLSAGLSPNGASVRQILVSILGEAPAELPDAILSINVGAPGSGEELFRFKCFEKDSHTVFIFSLNVGKISLSFMQVRHVDWDKKIPSKRIIKAAITKIPTIDVGIIGKLPQPFDQLFFLWTGGGGEPIATNAETVQRGITKKEYELLNGIEDISKGEKLFFKPIKKDYKDEEVVITAGSHIFVIMKKPSGDPEVLLDYAFKSISSKPKALARGDELAIWSAEGADNKGSKAPLKKSIGPLSIENIGLVYKDGHLGIMLDATFLMGPIGLSLLGFGVNVPFNEKFNLSNPPGLGDIGFSLEGMLVSFDRPPLSVAGGFKKIDMDGVKGYGGGLIIKFDPWQFQAAGVYANVSKKKKAIAATGNPDEFTMVFIYFKLNGPLFSVGFADISGLTGGFGINSNINTPTVSQVVSFPFVKPSGTGAPEDSPMKTLDGLLGGVWFTPSEGQYWVAAGLKASAFQMINVDAVLVLKFNPSVKIGIYGVATCDIPSSKSKVKFAYVELGIVCELDVEAGTFKVEAQLSPKSFILHQSCHLTGGFALFSWFKDGPNAVAGDWVMTIGGYHQAFVAPTQYPRPPRLRISWSLDRHLSVSGEAYFAITPKVCMGGGRLHAALSLGPLYAYFDAFVDFLINYKPFHFEAQGGVAVGVRFTLDLWIVTIRISVEIAASLKLRGPPFGGTVHVDFWVFGFDINFGASRQPIPLIDLEGFWDTALKDSKATSAKMLTSGISTEDDPSAEATAEKAFLVTCESGLIPDDKKKETQQNDPWFVSPDNFAFTTTFKFAANDITFEKLFDVPGVSALSDVQTQEVKIEDRCKAIYARPMGITSSLKSELKVTVSQYSTDAVGLRNTDPGELLAWIIEPRIWQITPIVKAVPQSVWGIYDKKFDPNASGNHSSALLNGKDVSTPLVMGLSIKPPEPLMSNDKITKFNIVKDMRQSVYTDKEEEKPKQQVHIDTIVPDFPNRGTALKNWSPLKGSVTTGEVVALWRNGKNDPEKVVELWASRLKFNPGVKMTGARPKALLKRYDQMVPAMPLIAVGSA